MGNARYMYMDTYACNGVYVNEQTCTRPNMCRSEINPRVIDGVCGVASVHKNVSLPCVIAPLSWARNAGAALQAQ